MASHRSTSLPSLSTSSSSPAAPVAAPSALPQRRAGALGAWFDRPGGGSWPMVAGGVLLGTIGVFVEEAGQHPLVTVWFRCALGALALLAWCMATRRWRELGLPARALAVAAATGVLMVVNWALFFAAIPRTSIAVATVVFHVQPIWVMLLGAVLLREAISRVQWGAVLVALAGLVLTTGLIDGAGLSQAVWGQTGYAAGVLMCLAGSLCYAAVTLLANTQKSIPPLALAFWQCTVGAIVMAWAPWVWGWPHTGAAWAWLAGLGVLHTGLAYVLLFAGMSRLRLGQIAVLQFVYPLTAVLVDGLVYGRNLQPAQWLGVGLMVAALWAIRRLAR